MSEAKGSASNGTRDNRYAAIYARVSTEDQVKGFSIPTQIEACQKLAAREGYTVPDGYFLVDEGISGTTMERPGLQRLRELVTSKAIAAVIVLDPDRLSRNLGHQLVLAEEMDRAGVKLLIVSHPMEQGPEGWLFFQMRGALAEYERAKLLERTRRGRMERARAGMPLGGRVPFGYRYGHGGPKSRRGWYEVEEEVAAVIRRIFRWCIEEGLPTRAIARRLSEERVPTERDRRGRASGQSPREKRAQAGVWSASTIHKILASEGYTGEGFWNKCQVTYSHGREHRRQRPREEWIGLAFPPIITREAFEAAQAQLQRLQTLARRNRKHEYLFIGGRLRCGRCGRAMSGGTKTPGQRFYRCGSYTSTLDPEQRCRVRIKADDIEGHVWRAVVAFLEDPDHVAAKMAEYTAETGHRKAAIAQERALVETALDRCQREAQRWADAYAAEVINLQEFQGYKAEIEARRRSLPDQHATLEAEQRSLEEDTRRWDAVPEYCRRVRQNLTTFTLEALNIRVTWAPGQAPDITGHIPVETIVSTMA